MIGLRGKSAVFSVLALLVALGALAALAGCGGSTSGLPVASGEVTQGAPTDSPAVVLGGYRFGSTSDRLTHPYFRATATTAKITWKGFGTCGGQEMTASFASGGWVARVRTLRVLFTSPGATTVRREYNWFAQDTQGNIHILRRREVDDGTGKKLPAQLVGVAARGKPRFWLVKNSLLKWPYIWYAYEDPAHPTQKTRFFKVLGNSAAVRGAWDLMQLQDIVDVNGDGVFDPTFGGPDRRQDLYFRKTDVSPVAILTAPVVTGGFSLN
jgi:hypothetical protein